MKVMRHCQMQLEVIVADAEHILDYFCFHKNIWQFFK